MASTACSFAGKVVLITGASSGIGAATAVHLSKLGALLSLNGRKADNLKEVAAKCGGPSNSLVVVGDVTCEADNQRLIAETIEKYGKRFGFVFWIDEFGLKLCLQANWTSW